MKDRHIVVTGGAQGIGEAIARRLACMGANLSLWDVKEESARNTAESIAKEFGVKAIGLAADVTSDAAIQEALKVSEEHLGGVYGLINNAGVTRDGLLIQMKESDWDMVLNINLKGVFLCTKAIARGMLNRKAGVIVNIASVVGIMGNPGQSNYSASKAGVIGLTKTWAKELASRRIRVNAVAPGYIQTAMTDKLPEKARQTLYDVIPLKEFGTASDVAEAAAFLASDAARYITGQVIKVDGGMVM